MGLKARLNLDKLLAEKGMSQRELARITGIRQPSINDMCNGKYDRHVPLKNIALICEALNEPVEKLIVLERVEDN
ncbi:helix-turn-helix domain-containing protein [Alicyclobacillus dauci]|uniref:Helix-turn-helix transcriptional regulator n=1 Tax=Alicyclobacillus dauci TaxID=1475485 RepID=A0ABY6ZAN2_9BACL|nr:helix-turn-helix transcriptional regulator [Alicyclobacillus dauci]WAH39517.1 helix-turn-helix transcriptional regulator [Alicyclobacillus dauci]WAH39577.1 helix-turn-helix transcriptional regulator [Alicyclobacillus dauci]